METPFELLAATGLTHEVIVEEHREEGSMWSEVISPMGRILGQRQVAHCCEDDDAHAIAALINMALRKTEIVGDRTFTNEERSVEVAFDIIYEIARRKKFDDAAITAIEGVSNMIYEALGL